MPTDKDVEVRLIYHSDLKHWLDLGWQTGLPWWHPVQAAYDRCYVWRAVIRPQKPLAPQPALRQSGCG